MLYYKQNAYDLWSLLLFIGGDLSPGKLLPIPQEAVADPLPKHPLFQV